MAKKIINTGTTDNDGTGDSLKAGAGKINDNFTEIYTTFGDGTNLTGGAGGGAQGIKGNTGSQGIQGFQGVQGRIGSNFNVFATEANVAINPPGNVQTFLNNTYPNAGIGSAVIDDLTNHIWVYQGGNVWLDGGDTSGAQGIAGQYAAQGLQGTIGTQGVQGLQGIQGSQGVQGVQGRDGQNAGQGTQGTFGIQGTQATQGTQGHIGIQGPIGIQGDLGAYGPQGVQGIMGYGAQGFQGIIGGVGPQGVFGQIGTTGGSGPQGVQGVQGLTGQGIQGNLGIQGGGGPAGNTGPQGLQGIQGQQGTQGLQGTQGQQGIQGVQGLQGLQGVQGLSHQGTQGLVGATGQDGSGVNYWQSIPATGLSTNTSVIIAGSVGVGTTALDTGIDLVRENQAVLSAGIGSFARLWSVYWDGFNATYDLGADGSNHYTITGKGLTGAESDPELTLIRGQKYAFSNQMGAHPFRIQSTPNGSVGTAYTDGIINNDVSNGTLYWDIQFDAPDVLYYQCTSHPNMGGKINVISVRNRAGITTDPGSFGITESKNHEITGHKTYSLMKVETSAAAWVTIYCDAASRTADASRLITQDPDPGSGVIAEAVTTGPDTVLFSPAVVGYNNDSPVDTTVYLKTKNQTGVSTAGIAITFTMLKMED